MFDESQFARWFRDGVREEGDPIPAATVVLVRDASDGLETLMLRKNSKLAFGGMWVFPGGRIDDADRDGAVDVVSAARRAAVREAAEEADLVVDEPTLAWISHWLPPGLAPRRYATWFFVAPAPEGAVTIDGGEIHDSAWMAPADALARRDAGEIELAPPTWMTLHHLAEFATVAELLEDARIREPRAYQTQIARCADGIAAVWSGDAAYGNDDPDAPGPRHRLWMVDSGWRLERTIDRPAQT
ncbi:MAG TPA: NUDIX domain-containing protein [Acidimicrobiia bacterium]